MPATHGGNYCHATTTTSANTETIGATILTILTYSSIYICNFLANCIVIELIIISILSHHWIFDQTFNIPYSKTLAVKKLWRITIFCQDFLPMFTISIHSLCKRTSIRQRFFHQTSYRPHLIFAKRFTASFLLYGTYKLR